MKKRGNRLKLTLIFLLASLTFVLPVSAQVKVPISFVGDLTLWIAIIIGLIGSVVTIYHAQRLKGPVLWFFGVGMLFVVIGFLSVVVAWAPPETQKIVHDIVFITGYVLMTAGALKLFNLSKRK